MSKSHLATALGVAAAKKDKSVYRATLAMLIEGLSKAECEGRLAEKIRFFAQASLLIFDEIGYLPITQGGAKSIIQLVNARYEKGAIILTSNRGFAEWREMRMAPKSKKPPSIIMVLLGSPSDEGARRWGSRVLRSIRNSA